MRHRDVSLRVAAQGAGQRETALAGHHDIEHDQIEGKAGELGARLGGVGGAGHAKAAVAEIAAQQLAQPQIVIDDKEVRLAVGHRAGLYRKPPLHRGRSRSGPPHPARASRSPPSPP